MSNTPTPRTDAFLNEQSEPWSEMDLINFARQLESELVEAKQEIKQVKEQRNRAALQERQKYLPLLNQWRKCAEELAERLEIHVRFMPDVDSRIKLTTFNKLKQQEKE